MLSGVGTVVAAVAALVALTLARGQLRELIMSNRMVANSNMEANRPVVLVRFEPRMMEMRDHRTSFIHKFTLVIENSGRSPAVDVRLEASPMPAIVGMSKGLKRLLAGETRYRRLFRGSGSFIGSTKSTGIGAPSTRSSWQPKFTIAADYSDSHGTAWRDSFPIDVSVLEHVIYSSDPYSRISKDLQALDSTNEEQVSALKSIANALDERRAAPVAGRRRIRR
jgi:hypothetical protein